MIHQNDGHTLGDIQPIDAGFLLAMTDLRFVQCSLRQIGRIRQKRGVRRNLHRERDSSRWCCANASHSRRATPTALDRVPRQDLGKRRVEMAAGNGYQVLTASGPSANNKAHPGMIPDFLVTHSGGFHADELLSSVILTRLFPKARIVRSQGAGVDHARRRPYHL